jgi:hypothetical protein
MLFFVRTQSSTKAGRVPKSSLRTTEFTGSAPFDMALPNIHASNINRDGSGTGMATIGYSMENSLVVVLVH